MTSDRVLSVDLDQVDFFSREVLADPYTLLARLRKERPVARFRQAAFDRDLYIVTPHALVEQVLRDAVTFSSRYNDVMTGGGKLDPAAEAIYATTWPEVEVLVSADEPDHMRSRSLVGKGFMPERIKRMSDLIGRVVTKLIDSFIERGECDFVHEFACPMPINSIAAIFDISPDYYDKLHVWTFALMRRIGQMGTREEQIADARCVVEMKEFIAKLVTERKGALGNDLLSDLITAKVDGHSALSRNELLSTVLLLLLGGAETTQSLLIAAMARLTQNPAQLDLLRKDLTLIPRVIEETLRFDPPAVGVWRIARHDTELAGVPIPKGAIVMVRLDSANRDEAVFEDPDRFDILRPQSGAHIAFGTGIHFCLGFRLAREQSTQSIRALVKRLEKVRMIVEKSDLRPHPSVSSRCMRELHLAFVPGTAGLNRAA